MQNESLSTSAYSNLGAAGLNSADSQSGEEYAPMYESFGLRPLDVNDALYYSRVLMQQQQQQHQQHQDMVNRHTLCLTRLREAAKEAEILRQENASLRSVNRELNKHINLLIKSSVNDVHRSNDFENNNNVSNNNAVTSFENMVNAGMRRLSIGGSSGGAGAGAGGDNREEVCVESPTSVMENVDVKRVSLPKSISVRSSGYLKTSPTAAVAAAATNNTKTRRTAAPLTSAVNLQSLFYFILQLLIPFPLFACELQLNF